MLATHHKRDPKIDAKSMMLLFKKSLWRSALRGLWPGRIRPEKVTSEGAGFASDCKAVATSSDASQMVSFLPSK